MSWSQYDPGQAQLHTSKGMPVCDVPHLPLAEDAIQHAGGAEQPHVTAVQGRERAPADVCLLCEENGRRLAISGRSRKQVFDLVQRKPPINHLHWSTRWDGVLMIRLRGQRWEFF